MLVAFVPSSALSLAPSWAEAQSIAPDDALARALAENPGLRASLYDALAAREARRAAQSGRRPVFVASANGQHLERLGGTAAGVVRNRDRSASGSVGLRYTTDVGTVVELDLGGGSLWREVNRDPSTTQLFRFGPIHSAQASLSARQPLLRGAGADVQLAEIRETRALEESATHEREQVASQLVQQVLEAYWELWYAQRAVTVQGEAITLAERQLEDARIRAETLGLAAAADTLQFATEVATLRESLVVTEAARRTRAIELGRLLRVGPADAVSLYAEVASPEAAPALPLGLLLESARHTSPELVALSSNMEAARVRVAATRNAGRARLDMVGSTSLGGVWLDDALPGLQLPGGRPAVVATLGFELELPVGPARGQAEHARAQAQVEAAEARYEARVNALEAEVAAFREELESARARLALAEETVAIARQLAEAERQRLQLGTTTPSELLRVQQSERQTELRRLRALVDAVAASVRVDHLSGRLLDRFSVHPHTEPGMQPDTEPAS